MHPSGSKDVGALVLTAAARVSSLVQSCASLTTEIAPAETEAIAPPT